MSSHSTQNGSAVAETVATLLAKLTDEERAASPPLLDNETSTLVERLTGRRPHRSALHRWNVDGVGGVHLEVLRVGSARHVTAAMLARFFAAAGAAPVRPRRVSRRRKKAGRAPRRQTVNGR